MRDVFRDLLDAGQTVLVHSSLKILGHLEEGPQSLLDEVLAALGPNGTLAIIGSTRDFSQTGVFDVRSSKADTGLLAETFRRMENVHRSPVPMASFLARGPGAARFTQPYQSYLDETSPMQHLLGIDGSIMLVGVGYDKCTLYHLSEERLQIEYNTYKTFSGIIIDDSGSRHAVHQRYYVRKDLSTKKSVQWLGEEMECAGKVKMQKLGDGLVRVFKARIFDQFCMAALQANRTAFLVK